MTKTPEEKSTWTAEEFSAFCVALMGGAYGWQTKIAAALGVTPRTVRRLASGEAPITLRTQRALEKMAGLHNAAPVAARDEWIVGDGARGPGGERREYVVHTIPPRFIARAVALDDLTGDPEAYEDPADVESGVVYQAGAGTVLAEFVWIDPPPTGGALTKILESACDALDESAGIGPG